MNEVEKPQNELLLSLSKEAFRRSSLELLKSELIIAPIPSYPTERLSYSRGAVQTEAGYHLPDGPWAITLGTRQPVRNPALMLQLKDTFGRPVHPWIDDMLTDEALGTATGRGIYYEWGPNETADPIILRTDGVEPALLLIKRRQTGRWALPGGHIDGDEGAVEAAIREAREEALIDLDNLHTEATHIYTGPVADVRMTANAWPETSAFLFKILDGQTALLPPTGMAYAAEDDADVARWVSLSEIPAELYGSHRLLIDLAMRKL